MYPEVLIEIRGLVRLKRELGPREQPATEFTRVRAGMVLVFSGRQNSSVSLSTAVAYVFSMSVLDVDAKKDIVRKLFKGAMSISPSHPARKVDKAPLARQGKMSSGKNLPLSGVKKGSADYRPGAPTLVSRAVEMWRKLRCKHIPLSELMRRRAMVFSQLSTATKTPGSEDSEQPQQLGEQCIDKFLDNRAHCVCRYSLLSGNARANYHVSMVGRATAISWLYPCFVYHRS